MLFNYKLNCFIVVELKLRELKKEDKAKIEFYMNLVDDKLKEDFHNSTIGIIVSRYQDAFIVRFVSQERVIPITYKLDLLILKIWYNFSRVNLTYEHVYCLRITLTVRMLTCSV